ncbi:MAG: hypothetical protein V8R55_09515 [Dysosmobacter sp.]
MVLLQDGLIAFFSAVGLTTVVWLVAGAVLHAGTPHRARAAVGAAAAGRGPGHGGGCAGTAPDSGKPARRKNCPGRLRIDGGRPGLARYLAEREKNAELVSAQEFHLGERP